ncbi:MAG: hypothetical protein LKF15_00050 [Lachnospiraceae bacterium]|nr:hypothetical protein [Lachnospiraceae bacterium]MCH4027356.1 hypothetical protein [Lachnospiraceae bacterium]MCH4065196.1 hypothetical protein [Lachnospiraceae bacterium]MCH4111236.1 hypothetical protein [Lachnospiraceae bacterium]
MNNGILKFNKGLGVSGVYTLTLKDARTGRIKQRVVTHNVWCTYGWKFFFERGRYQGNLGWEYACHLIGVAFGSGSGTPSSSDTALFTSLFTALWGSNNVTIKNTSSTSVDHDSRRLVFETVIPAMSTFTGTITELGLLGSCYSNQILMSHALVQDAEGNPISITKTDTDELTVRIELLVKRTASTSGINFNLRWGKYTSIDYMRSETDPVRDGLFSSSYGSLAITNGTNPDYMYDVKQSGDTNSYSIEYGSTTKVTISKSRFVATNSPSTYVNMLTRNISGRCFFGIVFPDSDIFAQRTLTGMALGTGDGSTTEYKPVLPVWVKDTDVIYKNGSALTRDVDYTCDNVGNVGMDVGMTAGNFIANVEQGDYGTGNYYIPGYSGTGGENVYATPDKPIIIKYYEDPLIGNSINAIVPGSWGGTKSGVTITFSVSENGTDYTDVLTVTATGTSFKDTSVHTLDGDKTMKYMKITPSAGTVYATSNDARFMHHGSGIVFKEAPAAGDVLTMDAAIDRPWKSPDYILDFSAQLSF